MEIKSKDGSEEEKQETQDQNLDCKAGSQTVKPWACLYWLRFSTNVKMITILAIVLEHVWQRKASTLKFFKNGAPPSMIRGCQEDLGLQLRWGQLSVSPETRTERRWGKDRLSYPSYLMPDWAYGSPGHGPPCLSFRAVSATTVPLTFPYWSPSDRAQLRPAIEPLMINSQILPCPQKR